MEGLEISEEEKKLRQEVYEELHPEKVPESAASINEESEPDPEPKPEPAEGSEPKLDGEPEIPGEDDPPEDPLAGLPPALIEKLDGINGKLSALDSIEDRLKQSEKRIGGITNHLHEAKKQAEKAPTEAELKEASKSAEKWQELKDDFPEWAEAVEGKLAAASAELKESIPDVSDLRESLNGVVRSEDLEVRLVNFAHPGWQETVNSSEYKEWLEKQPDAVQRKHYAGRTAEDAVEVLNLFKERGTKTQKSKDIKAAKKKRLEKSILPSSTSKSKPPKADADMTYEEIRREEEKKIWGNRP